MAKTGSTAATTRFEGFPAGATEFFAGLVAHNTRAWFQAHKDEYERACREPMKALLAEFDPRFGRASLSRINRDNRFFKNRPPYKTHLAAGVGGYYLSLAANGLYIGAGIYRPDSATLERLRGAVDRDESGRELVAIISALKRKGYVVDTHERTAGAPRGFVKTHARLDLLRMKDIFGGVLIGPGAVLSSRKTLDRVTRAMSDLKPLMDWLRHHVGG